MEKAKRQRGSGSLYRRKHCKLWTVQYYDADGRRVRESTGTTDRTVAERLLRKRLTEVDTGIAQSVAPGIVTVEVLWQGLLTYCQHNRLKRGTKDLAGNSQYEQIVERLVEHGFGRNARVGTAQNGSKRGLRGHRTRKQR